MEKLLKYSVLRYSPSTVAGEKINLGIIYSEENEKYRKFWHIQKFSRVANFDDEIDIKTVKKLLKSIEAEVVGDVYTYDHFDIEEYTKYFINDFCFEKPKTIKYESLDDTIEMLNKTYFRFDYDKADRPSKADDKKIIEQLIHTTGACIRKNEYLSGKFNDKIKFDFITDSYALKIFDFDDKNLNLLIHSAKTWAWNCMHEVNKKFIIIYRYNDYNKRYKEEFNIIMNIFKEANAKIYDMEDGIQVLQSFKV